MNVNKIASRLDIAKTFFREDYILHRDEGTGFEEIVSVLGEPADEEELDILAACVVEIMDHRRDLVETVRKIGEGFSRGDNIGRRRNYPRRNSR